MKKLIVTLLIMLILIPKPVIGVNYANYGAVMYDRSIPIHVEIKSSNCAYANSIDELLDWWETGNTNTWKYVNTWTNKFLISDTTKYGYPLTEFLPASMGDYECVVAHVEALIFVPRMVTIEFGLDSDDASAVLIDETPILSWLGGHAPNQGVKYSTTVTLTPGFHKIDGYVQDKTGALVLALYIKKNGVWKIIDSSDFIFAPVSGNPFENHKELLIHYTEDSIPIIGEWTGTIQLDDGTTNTFTHNMAILRADWNNKQTISLNEFRLTEGIEVPSKDYYVGHIYTVVYTPQEGDYEFGLSGDDGVDFRVDGKVVLSYYGLHGSSTSPQVTGTVHLTKGYHLFEVYYYEKRGGSEGKLFIKMSGNWVVLNPNNSPFTLYKPTDWYLFVREFKCNPNIKLTFAPEGGVVKSYFNLLPIEVKR